LFAEKDGSQSTSQITDFEDTWEWNLDAQRAWEQSIETGGQVADAMRAFRTFPLLVISTAQARHWRFGPASELLL
jgi:hypothetical protein